MGHTEGLNSFSTHIGVKFLLQDELTIALLLMLILLAYMYLRLGFLYILVHFLASGSVVWA